MGRPRIHDEHTRARLLRATEQAVAQRGLEAVSIRIAAEEAGTSTRAVYALFGSKDGLLQALAQHAFELLMEQVAGVPVSDDPGNDLITAAVDGFRRFAIEHPDLFRLFFTAQPARPQLSEQANATRLAALSLLIHRVERAKIAGRVGTHSVEEVTVLWDALCCGLAMRELCGPISAADAERVWTGALRALLAGLGTVSPGDS
jgi:AcrR family transcriptional regulator